MSQPLIEKAQQKEVANILAKLNAGKTLTPSERKLLAAGGETQRITTYDQLASALGITRRTISNWKRLYPDDCPLPSPAGDHDLAAWKQFSSGKLGANSNDSEDERGLKDQLISEQIRKLRLANDATEKQFIAIADVITAMKPTVTAIRTALDSLPQRAALKLPGDYHHNEDVIQKEVDRVLRLLAGAAWFDEDAEVDAAPVVIDTSDVPDLDEAGNLNEAVKPKRKYTKKKK